MVIVFMCFLIIYCLAMAIYMWSSGNRCLGVFFFILLFLFIGLLTIYHISEVSKVELEYFNYKNNTEYSTHDWFWHQDFIKEQEGKEK